MIVDRILNTLIPGRAAQQQRHAEDRKLDKELKETFPSSDPLASSQPGAGATGTEVEPSQLSPSQLAKARGEKVV